MQIVHNEKTSPEGQWIPLMDYAIKRGVSLSTLRRHIKAKKIHYKTEHGRYLLFDTSAEPAPAPTETELLKKQLQRAQEEIAELKTLIAYYEEQNIRSPLDMPLNINDHTYHQTPQALSPKDV